MIGIITGFMDKKAKVQLWQKDKVLLCNTHNLQYLKLNESYSKDGHILDPKKESGLEPLKSSKYTRLVYFLDNILKLQKSSPILIGDTPQQHWNSIEYWTIPCTAGSPLDGRELFIRFPEPCLIESLLTRDIDALVEVVNHQNDYMKNIVSNFREQIQNLLSNNFPGCKIVEAGSTSRGTNAMPISDLDIVCAFSSNSMDDIQSFEAFLDKLIPAIKEHHPKWKMKRKEIALGIENCINSISNRGEFQLPTKLYADVVFKSTSDIGAFNVAKRKSLILNGLPSRVLDAARIIKVILKCKMWPSAEQRPPSYLVDVAIKYFYEYGFPMICNRKPADPRPYIVTERKCYLFWKALKAKQNNDPYCIKCEKLVDSSYWECPRCSKVVCSDKCKILSQKDQYLRNIKLSKEYKFPEKACHKFATVPAARHSEFNNRQWIDPIKWRKEHDISSTYNYIIAFFHFGAYFDQMMIIFNKQVINDALESPYIQDPAEPTRNVVEKFKPNSFIKFCHTFIDDSSKGFYESQDLLRVRESFYKPFNSIFHLGSKVSILLCVNHYYRNEFESMIECSVDPRWPFLCLLEIHQASTITETPSKVFWDHSCAVFIDHRGLVSDPSVSMISRGISFGHHIYLENNDCVHITKESSPNSISPNKFVKRLDFVLVPFVKDDMKPDKIREPRYEWGHSLPDYPKFLRDKETGVMCHFKPDKNRDRALGPDFDFNPLNYHNLPEFSNYSPLNHHTKYTIRFDPSTENMMYDYNPVIKGSL